MENEITNKEKKVNKRYKIIIILLSSLLGIILIVFSVLSFGLFDNKKIEFSEYVEIMSLFDDSKDIDESIYEYGVRIQFYVDYEKHPKYKEWLETYNLKDDYTLEEKIENRYYYLMNKSICETMENFTNLEYNAYSQVLGFDYSITKPQNETIYESKIKMSKIKRDFFNSDYYKNTIDLSYENYISYTRILLIFPSAKDE